MLVVVAEFDVAVIGREHSFLVVFVQQMPDAAVVAVWKMNRTRAMEAVVIAA